MKQFTLSVDPIPLTERCTRRQTDYATNLAARTGSIIPTERKMLDYCNRNTMAQLIDEMMQGKPVRLK